jgi:hypothetical protein
MRRIKAIVSAAVFGFGVCAANTAAAFDRASVISGANLTNYASVYVAPVKVSLDSGERPVAPKDASAKASDLRRDIIEAFEPSHAVASAPGPEVLTISATLTRLTANLPTMADYAAAPGLSPRSIYSGGAAFEARLSSASGELAFVADDYRGLIDDRRPPVAVWEDADRAFASWARRLQDFVEEN